MNRDCDRLRQPIDALLAGNVDALSVEQVEQIEAHLTDCAACAVRLAQTPARPEPAIAALANPPGEADWQRVWQGIETARESVGTSERPDAFRGRVPHVGTERASLWSRIPRVWSAFAAAAVLMIMVGVWRLGLQPGGGLSPIVLAHTDDVRIESLEVSGSATSFVLAAGEDENIPIIWVVDDEGA